MRRREFLGVLGGAAAAWSLAAHAQQPPRMRRIGVLTPFKADDTEGKARLTAFAQGLQQLGWTVGQNINVDYRWGDGKAATMRNFANELVSLAPDAILADSSAAVSALLEATRAVPIVFAAVADPVGAGYVESLPRPGGNATGFAAIEYSMAGKWLELLKEIAPRVTRVAVLRIPPSRPVPAFSVPFRPRQHRSVWSYAPSIYEIPARSNVPWQRSQSPQMVASSCWEVRRRRPIASSSSLSRHGTGCRQFMPFALLSRPAA